MQNASYDREANMPVPAGRWSTALLTAFALLTVIAMTVRAAALSFPAVGASLSEVQTAEAVPAQEESAETAEVLGVRAEREGEAFCAYADPTEACRLLAETMDTYDRMSLQTATALQSQAREKLDEVGWDLRKAFDWCLTIHHNREIVTPDLGTRAMAEIGFNTGHGSCYVMSACFYEMAKVLGYDAHQVSGYVPRSDGTKAPHSWVEIDIDGVTYAYDISTMKNYHLNTYAFTYGTPGTWRYIDYFRMN
ncbi:MAG: transglutaminase domain-containing protein [Lachnospiraceae bacterium]|nr:transglutaminase domain-containing protein [Lachnospiraceae bacterium]